MVNVALTILINAMLVSSVLLFGVWTLADLLPSRHRRDVVKAGLNGTRFGTRTSGSATTSFFWERQGLVQRAGRP